MNTENYKFHKPVLLAEVLENLKPQDGEIYIDGTFGAGGYSRAILQKANCRLYAFDRDITVKKFADKLQKEFADNFHFIHSKYGEMQEQMENFGIAEVDAVILDLGVSSMQLDEDERGFSFNSDHKLDMRMDTSSGISAYEVVNQFSENELTKIIKEFGEEKRAYQIAKKIIAARNKGRIETASQLAEIAREAYGHKKTGKIDAATKTFQAIRIFVNDELGELKKGLEAAKSMLRKNGRLIVVSFHSLEDSYVKNFLKKESGYDELNYSRYDPKVLMKDKNEFSFTVLKNGAIKPKDEELEDNIRARSARLRVAIRN
jgi:16S rRNA (cytosine1402-N4)-methyltransferase